MPSERCLGEDMRFSDGKVLLAFFSILESWGAIAALQQTLILLSPAPIQTNTRGGDQNLQSIGS